LDLYQKGQFVEPLQTVPFLFSLFHLPILSIRFIFLKLLIKIDYCKSRDITNKVNYKNILSAYFIHVI